MRISKSSLGQIPYLNGGIFDVHELEGRIVTARAFEFRMQAFEQVFDFFDRYQWHLDERPLRADNEINPDVLGYIFEKYINQKQMGAYYTKEDITGYISKNTVSTISFRRRSQQVQNCVRESQRANCLGSPPRRSRPLHLSRPSPRHFLIYAPRTVAGAASNTP